MGSDFKRQNKIIIFLNCFLIGGCNNEDKMFIFVCFCCFFLLKKETQLAFDDIIEVTLINTRRHDKL
jgi:hypothetical protein